MRDIAPVAGNVRAELARRGLSQAALGEVLGISRQAVSDRLTGAVSFRIDELEAAANWFGIPLAELVTVKVAA